MKLEITVVGGPEVKADLTKHRKLAVHRTLGDGKGYVVTDFKTMEVVLWTRLQRDAIQARRELEPLALAGDLAAFRAAVERMRK